MRAFHKQSKCGMIQEGEGGHWPNSSKNLLKARYLWVLRTPQNNQEEGARARKLVICGTRGSFGRGQSVPFSAQGAYYSAPEPKEDLTGQELLYRSQGLARVSKNAGGRPRLASVAFDGRYMGLAL